MEENKSTVKAKKKIYQKWWFWVIIVVVIAIIAGAAGSGNDDENKNTESTQSNDPSSNGKASKTYCINDAVKVSDLEFTVLEVSDTKQIGSSLIGQSTDNNFVTVTISVKNNSKQEITLTSGNFHYYVGSNKYDPSSAALYLGESGFTVLLEVGSGLTKRTTLVFEIPSEHTENDYVEFSHLLHSEKVYCR